MLGAVAPGAARADASPSPAVADQLHAVYYQEGVLEYCGLLTDEVYDGYQRLVRYLVEAGRFDAATERRIRIDGSVQADYQFGNHGLVGQRLWCATDGQEYVQRFLDFRRRAIAGELD